MAVSVVLIILVIRPRWKQYIILNTPLGIPIEQIKDTSVFKMDAVEYIETLDLVARKFADYITFTEEYGVELGRKPRLKEKEFQRYLKR